MRCRRCGLTIFRHVPYTVVAGDPVHAEKCPPITLVTILTAATAQPEPELNLRLHQPPEAS